MADILIIGGGIGGLAAGIALQQHGFDAHVFEAAPGLQAVGAGIWMPPNGMSVLAKLDLAGSVLASGLALERIEVRDLDAGVLQAVDGTEVASRLGFLTVAIRRSELQRILAAALRPGSLHLGKRLNHFQSREATVQAYFADQSEVEGQLLIGADGIHSAVRRQLRPKVSLRYGGQTCFRGLAPFQLRPTLRHTAWEIWGGAVRFGFSSVGGQTVYWFAPITTPAGTQFKRTELKSQLLERYAKFPAVIREIIEATPLEAILQTDLYDFAPIQSWNERQVVLLGDAAHAMTPNLGQGGAQALEDALSLALKLQSMGLSPQALTEYERVRSSRTSKLVRLSWYFGKMAHWENPLVQRLRNMVLRATPPRVQQRQTDVLLTPQV